MKLYNITNDVIFIKNRYGSQEKFRIRFKDSELFPITRLNEKAHAEIISEARGWRARTITWGKRLSFPSDRVNASNLLGLPANAPTKL